MTFTQVWSYLRWVLALIGIVLVVQYAYPRLLEELPKLVEFSTGQDSVLSSTDEADAPANDEVLAVATENATIQAPTGPVEAGTAKPLIDFTVNDTIADVGAQSLLLTDDAEDRIVMAFPIPSGNPACVQNMTLSMAVQEATSPAEVGLFFGNLPDVANVQDNQQVLQDARLSPQGIGIARLASPGVATYDITEGYRRYFTQPIPAGSPLTLVLATTVPLPTQSQVKFAANEAGVAEPAITWTAVPDCS